MTSKATTTTSKGAGAKKTPAAANSPAAPAGETAAGPTKKNAKNMEARLGLSQALSRNESNSKKCAKEIQALLSEVIEHDPANSDAFVALGDSLLRDEKAMGAVDTWAKYPFTGSTKGQNGYDEAYLHG